MQNFMAVLALMGSLTDNETLRFQWSSEQGFDTSCGYSAAVALMDTWWNIPVTELELLAATAESRTADENYMVSFRSLSDLLASYGFAVKAYKMDWNELKAAVDKYAPVLVHLDGYSGHFALVLGFDGDTAIVADPAEGTRFATKDELEGKWRGNVLLAVHPGKMKNSEELSYTIADTAGRLELLERASRKAAVARFR